MELSRKEFLRRGIFYLGRTLLSPAGGLEAGSVDEAPIRPPGFAEGKEGACGGCTACLTACPAGIVVKGGDEGAPVLDFSRGGCSLCYLCIDACRDGVLKYPERLRLGVAETVDGRCLARGGCFSCLESCPEGAIASAKGREIAIDPEKCNGCGLCEYVCPVAEKAVKVVPPRAT